MSSVQSCFADAIYLTYLQKRYGINSCKPKPNIKLLLNDLHIATDVLKACNSFSYCAVSVDPVITPEVPIVSGGKLFISVREGTTEATALGLVQGAVTFQNDLLAGNYVVVIKGSIPLPANNPNNGGEYYTKLINDDFITFSDPILPGELILIFTT